jgi:hypothetical protein
VVRPAATPPPDDSVRAGQDIRRPELAIPSSIPEGRGRGVLPQEVVGRTGAMPGAEGAAEPPLGAIPDRGLPFVVRIPRALPPNEARRGRHDVFRSEGAVPIGVPGFCDAGEEASEVVTGTDLPVCAVGAPSSPRTIANGNLPQVSSIGFAHPPDPAARPRGDVSRTKTSILAGVPAPRDSWKGAREAIVRQTARLPQNGQPPPRERPLISAFQTWVLLFGHRH